MKAPPSKPFAIAFLGCLGLFIVWAIVGSVLEPMVTNPETYEKIKRIVIVASLGLFLVMAFSMVPVAVHLFFKMFFIAEALLGKLDHPFIHRLKENREKIATVLIYSFWGIYALGMLIAVPAALRDWLN